MKKQRCRRVLKILRCHGHQLRNTELLKRIWVIHEDLHGFIASMAEKIKINLAIVSANPVMVGTGPTKGIDKHTGLIICGTNPIAVDSICARLLGYMEQGIGYFHLLKNKGFSETDIQRIIMKGISLAEAQRIFSKEVYKEEMEIDTK